MQARGEVRRLANDPALLRLARADEIADHNQTGRDPNPHLQRRAGRCDQFRHRFNNGKPRSNGALGVVFVGLRKAKIGEHAVAHILRDKPGVALNQLGGAMMIRANHAVQVFGIELNRKRSRTDEIAEHHGQLASLCPRFRREGRDAGVWRRLRLRGQIRNRFEEALTMAQRRAELFEIGFSQFRQNFRVNFAFAKDCLILPESKATEPVSHVHG